VAGRPVIPERLHATLHQPGNRSSGPPILTATAGKLGDDLIHGKNSSGQRFASIPAFTSDEPGKPGGMLCRRCTAESEIDVVERVIRRRVVGLEHRRRMPKGVGVVQSFGLSSDEPRRASGVRSRFVGHPWAGARFPPPDPEMTRSGCVAYLKGRAIPHEVPRSACVLRPYRSDAERRHLRDTGPARRAGAVEVDGALRAPGTVADRSLEQAIYLHRSCLPPVDVDFGGRDMTGGVARGECEGTCGL